MANDIVTFRLNLFQTLYVFLLQTKCCSAGKLMFFVVEYVHPYSSSRLTTSVRILTGRAPINIKTSIVILSISMI